MNCKLCNSDRVKVIYNDVIRNGGIGRYTNMPVEMYQCEDCGVIWHNPIVENINEYYESTEYRALMDEGSDEKTFYVNHDKETLDKFKYTGTEIFRDKVIADVGCGAGAFLDFLKGVASEIVAIEPSEPYRKILRRKGFFTYAYAKEAASQYGDKVDIATSFDVIEHVDDPRAFLKDIYALLARKGGTLILGAPTDAPVMRELLGEHYEKKVLFSVQHLWIFSGENLCRMAEEVGFRDIEVRYYQRYGIGNVLGWCFEKRPGSNIHIPFIENEIDAVWRGVCSAHQVADYVVLYARK